MKWITSIGVLASLVAFMGPAAVMSLPQYLNSTPFDAEVSVAGAQFLHKRVHIIMDEYATELADTSMAKCAAAGKEVDHLALKFEWLDCTRSGISTFMGKLVTIFVNTVLNPEVDGLDADLFRLPVVVPRPKLTPKQRNLVKRWILGPTCSAFSQFLRTCEFRSYEALTRASMCNTKAEDESRELSWIFMRDVCAGDMDWLIDFSEAVALEEFVDQTGAFAMTDSFQEKLKYLLQFEDKSPTVGFKGIATQEEFCNVTALAGELLTGLFVTPSGNKSRAADILRATFSNTISAYKNKCSKL